MNLRNYYISFECSQFFFFGGAPLAGRSLGRLHQPGIYVGLKTHVYMGQLSPWHTHPHLCSTVHGAWVRHELTQHHGCDAELQCCVRACPVAWFLKAWRFSGN